jgi:hypothetical protein
MSSGGLVPQGNFAQTGTLDWVRMGEGVVSLTLKALSQMVNCGVDSFTILLGMQVAQQLPLGRKGEIRVRDAIRTLQFYAGLNKDLLFGFGLRSIPHMLEIHAEGLALLAISAALSEVYVEEVAAEVLNEILLYQNPTRETTPSLQSWSKIIKACAGTLAKTNFGIIAEKFMSFHPSETSLFPTRNAKQYDDTWRSRSHSKDIAKALLTLGQISRAELESVTIVGGGDSGFLAAVAEWLFDMNIVIVDNTGQELYRTTTSSSTIHARFVFRDRIDGLPSQSMDLEAFQYLSKIVHLKDVSDNLFANDRNDAMKACGRLEWSLCLSTSFGDTFKKLMGHKSNFSQMLGCAGRIFEAVVKAEPGTNFDTRKHWIYYTDAGSGYGYVQNLVFWFPELKDVESRIQEAAACKLLDARINYESSLGNLAKICGCVHCNRTRDEEPPGKYCLVVVVETILKAALILSNVYVEPSINPVRSGFVRLYERQIEARWLDEDACERIEEELGPIVWVIEPEKEDEDLYTVDHRMRLMMDGALGLFTYLPELEDSFSCAVSSGGICVYRKILEGLSIHDNLGYALGRIQIVPGRIEWNGITFDRVQDWYSDSSDRFRMMEDEGIDPEEMDFGDPSLKMEQTLTSLRVAYCLSNSRQHVLNIPPAYLANTALMARGLFRCQHHQAYNHGARTSERDLEYQILTLRGKEVALYKAPNDRSVCAALAIANLLYPKYFVIWDDKCLECALESAVAEVETENRLFIVSFTLLQSILELKGVQVSRR